MSSEYCLLPDLSAMVFEFLYGEEMCQALRSGRFAARRLECENVMKRVSTMIYFQYPGHVRNRTIHTLRGCRFISVEGCWQLTDRALTSLRGLDTIFFKRNARLTSKIFRHLRSARFIKIGPWTPGLRDNLYAFAYTARNESRSMWDDDYSVELRFA